MILTDIISTVTGREHGSFRWKVQYLCKNVTDLKIKITFEDYIISILIKVHLFNEDVVTFQSMHLLHFVEVLMPAYWDT